MKDARLAELEFLMFLAHHGPWTARCRSDLSDAETYGLGAKRFRDMVLGLLDDGCLNGPASVAWSALATEAKSESVNSVVTAFRKIASGQASEIALNHDGWLRLARLQDELKSNRIRERFGILYDQRHWSRDLSISMLSASAAMPLSLALSDLDHFKAVNDEIGYDRGDACLRRYFSVASVVLGPEGDLYCRGGDEILAILPGVPADRLRQLTETLRREVEAEFSQPEADGLLPITVSIGAYVITAPTSNDDASRTVTRLLHEAKHGGRNQVAIQDAK